MAQGADVVLGQEYPVFDLWLAGAAPAVSVAGDCDGLAAVVLVTAGVGVELSRKVRTCCSRRSMHAAAACCFPTASRVSGRFRVPGGRRPRGRSHGRWCVSHRRSRGRRTARGTDCRTWWSARRGVGVSRRAAGAWRILVRGTRPTRTVRRARSATPSVPGVRNSPGASGPTMLKPGPAQSPKAPPSARMSRPRAIRTTGSRMWPQRASALAMTGRVAKNLPAKHQTATRTRKTTA